MLGCMGIFLPVGLSSFVVSVHLLLVATELAAVLECVTDARAVLPDVVGVDLARLPAVVSLALKLSLDASLVVLPESVVNSH